VLPSVLAGRGATRSSFVLDIRPTSKLKIHWYRNSFHSKNSSKSDKHLQRNGNIHTTWFGACTEKIDHIEVMTNVIEDLQFCHQSLVFTGRSTICRDSTGITPDTPVCILNTFHQKSSTPHPSPSECDHQHLLLILEQHSNQPI